jgi:hypothetical protein
MSPYSFIAHRRHAFTFLEVLLVLGIVGMMVLCLIGFVLSNKTPPLKIATPTPPPANATPAPSEPAPAATPAP